ncbi:NUDIX domain-containing protein [Mucilaginibacter daejeonensis]|uniref:NUDIX hydrolase n=1 Tax=Mucilaginibacter daejeonensis TaxID=398049 RepID=UPI001D1780E2|nr:NUDIX domain-containing protein [Mucilaginibacter daejeonensis]UEG54142.1 NUDIX domain-containing protein [Mucilaginibacter daejeonensis]
MITQTTPANADKYEQLDQQSFDLKTLYNKVIGNNPRLYYYVLCDDAKAFLKKMMKSVTVIKAAGGLVKNDRGNFLFIFRNGKWDLPKGKLEKGEKSEEGAVREVEEECGISIGKCGKKIVKTYHVYTIKGEVVLKKTYWYKMKYKGNARLKPQIEEGITDVRWMDRSDINTVAGNTFPSIKDVLLRRDLLANIPTPLLE